MGGQASKAKAKGATHAEAQRTPRDELNNRLFFRLFQAGNVYHTAAMRELNISAVQGAVLGALSREPQGMSFSALYGYLSVSRQNLDAVLKRLEAVGYAERVEGATDRRMKTVRLTRPGAAAWNELHTRTIEFFRQGTTGVTADEAEACAATLAKITRALKATNLG